MYRSAEVTIGERLRRVILTGASTLDDFGPCPGHTIPVDSQTITGASPMNQR